MVKDTNKVEETFVIALRQYLLRCPRIDPIINVNDKTPFWDGDLYVYKDEQKGNKKDNFHGRVPVKVKGSYDNSLDIKIDRADAEAYMIDGGCLFFKVLMQDSLSSIIYYSLLSKKDIKKYLRQSDENIILHLEVVPNNPLDFQQIVYEYVRFRNRMKVEYPASKEQKNSAFDLIKVFRKLGGFIKEKLFGLIKNFLAPKEIRYLLENFEGIRRHLNEIEDKKTRFELESALDSIKYLKYIGTIGWRDKYFYYSLKALDLAINNLKGYDFSVIQHNLGLFLQEQKRYHFVENYYLMALQAFRKRAESSTIPSFKKDLATALNNLANLHKDLTYYEKAEQEYREALDIFHELAMTNRNAYIEDIAGIHNNLANLYDDFDLKVKAEREYREALHIYRELAKKNRNAFIKNVADTLCNLVSLDNYFVINRDLDQKYQKIYYEDMEQKSQEALEIYRELAETNHKAFILDVAMTLNNLAYLHAKLARYEEAEEEYKEALEYYRNIYYDTNRATYIEDEAKTLENLALLLQKEEERQDEAIDAASEALYIYQKLADKYPQKWNKYVEKTKRLLDELNVVKK